MINLSVRVSEMSAYVGGALALIGKVSYALHFVVELRDTQDERRGEPRYFLSVIGCINVFRLIFYIHNQCYRP
jgi:hypothetical protein